jgi:hypothetical protein
MVGERIINFCKGMKIMLMQKKRPVLNYNDNSYNNKLSHENNIFWKLRNEEEDVLKMIKIRFKRHLLQGIKQRIRGKTHPRYLPKKREALPFLDGFHGQTQSQYFNIGANGHNEGKAEAEASQQSSRAVVSEYPSTITLVRLFEILLLMNFKY